MVLDNKKKKEGFHLFLYPLKDSNFYPITGSELKSDVSTKFHQGDFFVILS